LQVASDESRHAPPDRQAGELPRQPVVLIDANRRWAALDFAALWQYRELFYFLMWRDLKVRYKQTILGALWVVLQPVLITAIFTIFLGKLMRVPSDGIPYPVFAYASLLLWTFVSNAILSSSYSLVANAQIITRVYFSRLLIPAATIYNLTCSNPRRVARMERSAIRDRPSRIPLRSMRATRHLRCPVGECANEAIVQDPGARPRLLGFAALDLQ